jgi:hypothetical protein
MLEDLSDEATADATSGQSTPAIAGEAPRILCIAGRNEFDEIAASLLVNLLRSEYPGAIAETLPVAAVTSDRYQSSLELATVICLSLISTHSPARARYLVRRLYRRAPGAKILLGFWQLDPGDLAATVGTIARPNIAVVTSLRDAVASLEPELTMGRTAASAC